MEEKYIECVAFKIVMPCDECGGEYNKTGHSKQNGNQALFLHVCSGCSKQIDLPKQYPILNFVPLDRAKQYRPAEKKRATKAKG